MFSRGENPSTVAPVGPTDSSSPPFWGDKRRGGRPVLLSGETSYAHQEEWRVITEKAKATGLCVSVYVREAALANRVRCLPEEHLLRDAQVVIEGKRT